MTSGMKEPSNDVIDLLLSDSDNDNDNKNKNSNDWKDTKQSKNCSLNENGKTNEKRTRLEDSSAYEKIQVGTTKGKTKTKAMTMTMTKNGSRTKTTISQGLQAGLVLEEDIFAAISNDDDGGNRKAPPNVLFEDPEFGPMASSIQGVHRVSIADTDTATSSSDDKEIIEKWRPKCRCNLLSALSYNKEGRPHFSCGKQHSVSVNNKTTTKKGRKCKFFAWAFRAELVPWYRFGSHNEHVLVRKDTVGTVRNESDDSFHESSPSLSMSPSTSVFSAQDLVQGKVGDCWFLSALAVVAERSDLVERIFRRRPPGRLHNNEREDEQRGIVRVNLFLDGIWKPVTMDNFLPCCPGGNSTSLKEEEELQKAIEASLLDQSTTKNNINKNNNGVTTVRNPYAKSKKPSNTQHNTNVPSPTSGNDPRGLSETNLRIMRGTADFLEKDYQRRRLSGDCYRPVFLPEGRDAQTHDLAYSKARRNQLWVPFLEKAYAKIHGSYQAISGGHVAEAFLDLTGAPTLQIVWHAGRAAAEGSSSVYNDPKKLWEDLKRWRRQKLPMGCGTDRSAGGLIGMHAYSILDVRELTNVGVDFFRDRLVKGTLGNVSGFTEYDGKLRLLRVRNPHGKGEWKGEFSDKCKTWQTLLASSGITLPRTMADDGTFWIGYDDFLLGFSNIDVVLAFEGNHAKSFVSNFPPKKSNHRCQRAFEVSLLDPQPGLETKDRVEVFVMGIQKSKRGARQGRADRKKSYKVSDLGILVGEYPLEESGNGDDGNDTTGTPFFAIRGQMFGFNRNGHYKFVLDRRKCKRLVVMPISFGHPAATDEFRSFVVRFNADAPLMIRELETTPRMDRVLGGFLMVPKPFGHFAKTRQGLETVLWKDSCYKVVRIDCLGNNGGTVFVYLCALQDATRTQPSMVSSAIGSSKTLGFEATCRGMSCRVAKGLLEHETTEKGKKFQASWRKFKASFVVETNSKPQSRLLMVLYQSGQDTEMGSIKCKSTSMGHVLGMGKNDATPSMSSTTRDKYWKRKEGSSCVDDDYEELGVFHPITMDADAFRQSGSGSSEMESDYGGHHPVHIYDDSEDNELAKAMALSRQDQNVVDSNSAVNGNASTEDAILQEALELSCEDDRMDAGIADALRRSFQEAHAAGSGSGSGNGNSSACRKEEATVGELLDLLDDEPDNNSSAAAVGEVAIIELLKRNNSIINNNEVQSTVDLTAVEAIPVNAKNAKNKNNKNRSDTSVVLDLTTTNNVEMSTPMSPKNRVERRDGKKQGAVFIVVDSSDEEDERGSSEGNDNKNDVDSKVEKDCPSDTNKRTMENNNDNREKKRKLAAEAAFRRFKKWP